MDPDRSARQRGRGAYMRRQGERARGREASIGDPEHRFNGSGSTGSFTHDSGAQEGPDVVSAFHHMSWCADHLQVAQAIIHSVIGTVGAVTAASSH